MVLIVCIIFIRYQIIEQQLQKHISLQADVVEQRKDINFKLATKALLICMNVGQLKKMHGDFIKLLTHIK